jgi:putative transposase
VSHKKPGYTSDLSDGAWQRIVWLLPKKKGAGRPVSLDMRASVNAMLYVLVTGCQWRNLPGEFPKWQSVYYHFYKWSRNGTLYRLNRVLGYLARRQLGRFARPSAGVVDSQSAKTQDYGDLRGYDGHKKVKGRKRHLLTDSLGNILEVVVSAANTTDVEGAIAVLSKVDRFITQRLLKLWADQGYQGEFETFCYNHWGIQVEIVRAEAGQVGFAVQPHRWVVERTFAWLIQHRRLTKDFEKSSLSSEGMIYLASIRLMIRRLAA